jgi:hypothetical protein
MCMFELFQQMRTNTDDVHVHKLELGGSPPVPFHKRPLLRCNVCFERGKSGTESGFFNALHSFNALFYCTISAYSSF